MLTEYFCVMLFMLYICALNAFIAFFIYTLYIFLYFFSTINENYFKEICVSLNKAGISNNV